MNEDPYRVLGVERGATADEVKSAYRRLAKEYHPDRNNGSASAEAKMKEINDAYARVMDDIRHPGSSSSSGGSAWGGSSYGGSAYGRQSSWGGQTWGSQGWAGQSWDSAGWGGGAQGSPQFTAVRNYLAYGRYSEAMNALNSIPTRTAEWYYCAAQAMVGMGNRVAALDYAQQAVQMDPSNAAYSDLLTRLEYASGGYQQTGAGFGGMPCAANNLCSTYLLLNALCCCCGGGGCYCC